MADIAAHGVAHPKASILHRKQSRIQPFGRGNLILFAVVSVCYRSESVCVFAVEPRQELIRDTNGMDAVRRLSAVANRHNTTRSPLPVRIGSLHTTPLLRLICKKRIVGDGGRCGSHQRTVHPRDAQGGPSHRHDAIFGRSVKRGKIVLEREVKWSRNEERRLLYKHLIS